VQVGGNRAEQQIPQWHGWGLGLKSAWKTRVEGVASKAEHILFINLSVFPAVLHARIRNSCVRVRVFSSLYGIVQEILCHVMPAILITGSRPFARQWTVAGSVDISGRYSWCDAVCTECVGASAWQAVNASAVRSHNWIPKHTATIVMQLEMHKTKYCCYTSYIKTIASDCNQRRSSDCDNRTHAVRSCLL